MVQRSPVRPNRQGEGNPAPEQRNAMIPPYGINQALPPTLGESLETDRVTPYDVTLDEFCRRFGWNAHRQKLLTGYCRFRLELLERGIHGFQWVDGGFVEKRDEPGDIDVVTFVSRQVNKGRFDSMLAEPTLMIEEHSRAKYDVHHFAISLNDAGERIVGFTAFWCGVFSHQRGYRDWKGMLRIELKDAKDDIARMAAAGIKP